MSKHLVKFQKDWADELDVYGFKILDDTELQDLENWTINSVEFYFGTNEGWEEGEVTMSDFTITSIDDEEEEILVRLIGSSEFGNFPDIYYDPEEY